MAIQQTTLTLPQQKSVYHGKVRDVYRIAEDYILLVASDRISAFDHILPRPIPYKGQVLSQLAAHFLRATQDLVPNWLLDVPHPNLSLGYYCQPIPLEMVVRGYLTGHAWRVYQSGERLLCGVPLPEGLKEHDKLPQPIITPATKAEEGHDEDISKEEILKQGIVSPEQYAQLESYALALFQRGTEMAAERDLILVDTKYEFGLRDGKIYLIDEVHTPDSSRFFIKSSYAERQAAGEAQQQLSKEFVREWLMEHGFQGKEGQLMPEMSDSFVEMVAQRYLDLYERLTGQPLATQDSGAEQLQTAAVAALAELGIKA